MDVRFGSKADNALLRWAMATFDYDDILKVSDEAPAEHRRGATAWVVGVTPPEQRRGAHFDQFPLGTVYLVEFEDGQALDIHESHLTRMSA